MLVSSLTLFTCLAAVSHALPGLQRRQDVVWTTVDVVHTVDEIVATEYVTGYETVQAAAPTQVATSGTSTVEQEQVVINEITVEYTYSSARTVFVVPTVVTSVITTTATVSVFVTDGATVTPEATATITNSINAQQTPVGTDVGVPVTATLPLVSVLIEGATVTVSEQTYTYYTPVVDDAGLTVAASTTLSATPTAAVVSVSKLVGSSPVQETSAELSVTSAEQYTSAQDSSSVFAVAPSATGSPSISGAIETSTPAPGLSSTSSTAGISLSSHVPAASILAVSSTIPDVSSIATTASTPAASATSSVIADSDQDSFVTSVLTSMNNDRALHSAPAFVWNYTLASSSLEYAETCVFAHSDDSDYGETLAAGTSSDPTFYIDLWYAEGSSYNYSAPGFSEATGHFTQLVWVSTTSVGCGFSSGCGEYPDYLVCRYYPAGNVIGGTDNDQYFIENVLEY